MTEKPHSQIIQAPKHQRHPDLKSNLLFVCQEQNYSTNQAADTQRRKDNPNHCPEFLPTLPVGIIGIQKPG